MEKGFSTSDYYFDLPKELIAQDPLEDRSSSRILRSMKFAVGLNALNLPI